MLVQEASAIYFLGLEVLTVMLHGDPSPWHSSLKIVLYSTVLQAATQTKSHKWLFLINFQC